jgi:uncharacterized integral membrane protein (TIGR00698 family)
MTPAVAANASYRKHPLAWLPGLLLTIAVAALAIYLSELPFPPFTLSDKSHPLEPVMLAIVLGMIVSNVALMPKLVQPGIKLASKKLLPLGVILLGARLDFYAIVRVGAAGLVMSVLTIAVGLGLFVAFIHLGWVKRKLGLLLGIGTAICGGTAIVAAAPVIDADDEDVTFGVATVTLVGLIAMFTLPLVGRAMHMDDWSFGVWSGLSIHQTPQVIAAGFAYSEKAGETATIVKLARVSLLAPALVIVAWLAMRERAQSKPVAAGVPLRGVFPYFVLGFLLMAFLRTMGWLPTIHFDGRSLDTVKICDIASKLLIVIAMAGVGLETKFAALRRTGMKPLLLGMIAAAVICALLWFGVNAISREAA